MSKMAELAHDLDALTDQPDPRRDAEIARVAERLSILGHDQESAELAKLAYDLRAMIAPPTCAWCNRVLPATALLRHHTSDKLFCSRSCLDEHLLIPDVEVHDDRSPDGT